MTMMAMTTTMTERQVCWNSGSETGMQGFQHAVFFHQHAQGMWESIIEEPIDSKNEPSIDNGTAFLSAMNEKILHNVKAIPMTTNTVKKAIPNDHARNKNKMFENSDGVANAASLADLSNEQHTH